MNNDQAESLRALMGKTKSETAERKARVYAFIGESGSGNTTVVSNLSTLLANDRKRVVLLDFNSGLMTTDMYFNVIPSRMKGSIVNSEKSEKDMLVRLRENLYAVYANSVLESSAEEKSVFVEKLEKLRSEVDVVIADIEGVDDLDKLEFFLKDAEIIFVTTPDAKGVQEAYYGIKYLKSYMTIEKAGIIINKADCPESYELFYEKIESTAGKFLGVEVEKIGYICTENRIKSSIKSQALFVDMYPDIKSTSEITAIAEALKLN